MKKISIKSILVKMFPKKILADNRKKINPERDWKWLMVVFIVLNIGVFSASIYIIYKIQNDSFLRDVEGGGVKVQKIDKGELDGVLMRFKEKKERMDIVRIKNHVSDPSL